MLSWLGSLSPDWLGSQSSGGEGESSTRVEPASTGEDEPASGAPVEARADGTSTEGEGATTSWDELLDDEGVSKQQVWIELGLSPDEFLVELVCRSGGRMWQADIVATTGWSKSTVSRHLGDLESRDAVARVQIGRRKLVGVPGEMPDGVSGSEAPPAEFPRERPSGFGEPV